MKKNILLLLLLFSLTEFIFAQDEVFKGKVFDKIKLDILASSFAFNNKLSDDIRELSFKYSFDYMIKDKYAIKICGSEYFDVSTNLDSVFYYQTYGIGFGYFFFENGTEELALKIGIVDKNDSSGFYYDIATKIYFCRNMYAILGLNHQFHETKNIFSGYLGFGIRIF